jgi:iron(III) transport system ATP-binding protein
MVSHDATDVMAWAEEIYIFKNGKIIQSGTPEYLYHYPINEYCANLLGDCFLVENSTCPFISSHLKLDYSKKIFLRPSYFSIVDNRGEDSISGTITKIVFKGNYSVIHVLSNGCIFHITCIEPNNHQVGNEIAFYFNRENVHYI